MLREASELRQDPRRTSHLSRPKHFMLSEASELRQDPRRTSHLSRPKHFMLSEASELSQIRGVLHSYDIKQPRQTWCLRVIHPSDLKDKETQGNNNN